MTTVQCTECGKTFAFSQNFRSEGCTPVEKCPFCHAYVELTSDKIMADTDPQALKKTNS